MKLTRAERLILHNQRAVMVALLQHATAVSTKIIRSRIELTDLAMKIKPRKRLDPRKMGQAWGPGSGPW